MPRVEDFRFATDVGIVIATYPAEWAVDILDLQGSIIRRATIVGARFPEVSTPQRPQWVLFGWMNHAEGHAWARAMNRELPAARATRSAFLYYEEAGLFRITISHEGVFEVRCRNGRDADDDAPLYRLAIDKADGVIQLDTPHTRLRLRESDQGADLTVDGPVTINCDTATVTAGTRTVIDCDDIRVGDASAYQPAVLGTQLALFYTLLVKTIFDNHVHVEGGNVPTTQFPEWVAELLSEITKLK